MFPDVEVRHLQAVIVLADDLSFTRAAQRLHISQPALSKQITDLEAHLRFQLFVPEKHRIVDLTDSGRIFVEEGRSALMHTERAVYLGRAAHEGCGSVLMVGHSHYADHAWISGLLAIHLPLFPKLRIRLITMFAIGYRCRTRPGS